MARPKKETGNTVPGFTSEFERRLETLISEVGGQEEAAVLSGASYAQLTSWKFGRSRPDFFALTRLCNAGKTSITWLATGIGPRDSSAEVSQESRRTQQEQPGVPMLQVADVASLEANAMVLIERLDVQASAGTGLVAQTERSMGFMAFNEAHLRELGVNPRFARIIEVSGRSMLPTLADGDLVVVDTSIDSVIDEALYAVVYGGMILVKRVRLSRDGTVTLSSDNKEEGHLDEVIAPVDLPQLHIAGRVRVHVRTL